MGYSVKLSNDRSNTDMEDLNDKLLRGQCTSAELHQLFNRVKTLPRKEAETLMQQLWQHTQDYPALQAELSEEMYEHIAMKIDHSHGRGETNTRKKSVGSTNRQVFRAAIAATVLSLIGIFAWQWLDDTQEVRMTTGIAEQQTYILPDGSTVTLNANSKLTYRGDWKGEKDRRVVLQGEAFFEVKKKGLTGQKFLVATEDLTVEVLGTSFNVNSHHKRTKVYLEEGKIALKLRDQPTQKMMKPGDLITYSSESKKLVSNHKKVSQNIYTSWKNGVLVFEETPLREVLLKIEEIYGISIQTKQEVHLSRKITTGLPVGELKIVLPMLEKAMNLKIVLRDDLYVIE